MVNGRARWIHPGRPAARRRWVGTKPPIPTAYQEFQTQGYTGPINVAGPLGDSNIIGDVFTLSARSRINRFWLYAMATGGVASDQKFRILIFPTSGGSPNGQQPIYASPEFGPGVIAPTTPNWYAVPVDVELAAGTYAFEIWSSSFAVSATQIYTTNTGTSYWTNGYSTYTSTGLPTATFTTNTYTNVINYIEYVAVSVIPYMGLVPSGTETYTPPAVYTDSATVGLTFTPNTFKELTNYIDPAADIHSEFGPNINVQNELTSFDTLTDPVIWRVQRFIPPNNCTIRSLGSVLRQDGTPTDQLIVEIRDEIAGKPGNVIGGTQISYEAPISGSATLDNRTVETIPLSATLVGGTTYYIVWRRSGSLDNSNYFGVYLSNKYSPFDSSTYSSSSHNFGTFTNDVYFELRFTDQTTDAHLTLTPSGTETLVPSVPTTDSATVGLKFTPSVSDIAIYVECAPDYSTYFPVATVQTNDKILSDPAQWVTETFTANLSGEVRILETLLRKVGSPTDQVIVEIRDVNAGKPGTTIFASGTYNAADVITGTLGLCRIPMTNFSPLVSGTGYFVTWRRSGVTDIVNRCYTEGQDAVPPFNGGTYNTVDGTYTPGGFYDNSIALRYDQATDAHLTLALSGSETAQLADTATVSLVFTPSAAETRQLQDYSYDYVDGNISHAGEAGASTVGIGASATQQQIAGSFVPSSSFHLGMIELAINRGGTLVDSIYVELRADSSSHPSGTVLATSPAISDSFSGGNRLYKFYLDYDLVSGTKYWIVANRTGAFSASNIYAWYTTRIDTSANIDSQFWNGTAWTAASLSQFAFGLYTLNPARVNGLVLTPSGSETYTPPTGVAYTDSATAAVLFTPSGTELPAKEYVETATAAVLFTLSATELREEFDAATVGFVFTLSATELKARDLVDTATVTVVFTPSVSEIREEFDAATVGFLFTVSATEIRERTDSGTVPLLFTTSAAEIVVLVDSGIGAVLFTLSSTEVRERVDASTIPVTLIPSASEVLASTDSLTSSVVFTVSATETLERTGADSDTGFVIFTPSSTEVGQFTEAAAVNLVMGTSGVEAAASVDSQTSTLSFTVSGTDVYGAGVTTVDTGTTTIALSPSSSDVTVSTDSQTSVLVMTPTGLEIREMTETGLVPLIVAPQPTGETLVSVDSSTSVVLFTPSGTEFTTATGADSGVINLLFTESASEIGAFIETSTATVIFGPSSSEVLVSIDTQTARVTFTPSGTETAAVEYVDAATNALRFSITATEFITHEVGDAATVPISFTITTTIEIAALVDSAVAFVVLTPSTVEVVIGVDADTVPLLFTITSFETPPIIPAEFIARLVSTRWVYACRGQRTTCALQERYAGVAKGQQYSADKEDRWSLSIR